MDVHQYDVGTRMMCEFDRLVPVRGLGDDHHVLGEAQKRTDALADHGLIVGEEHPD